MVYYRCFLQCFLFCLAYLTLIFFGWDFGILQNVWASDASHMTVLISGVFILVCSYIGFASYRFDYGLIHEAWSIKRADADASLGRVGAFLVTLLGLLGTVLGLRAQVSAMGAVDISNPQNILNFISAIGGALGTALYATATGIVAAIGITVLTTNLEYFIDRNEPPSPSSR